MALKQTLSEALGDHVAIRSERVVAQSFRLFREDSRLVSVSPLKKF